MPDTTQGATQQTAAQTTQAGEQQTTAQQTQQTPTATATTQATTATTQQQTQAQPSAEELAQQLAQLREQNANLEKSARHFQSLADRNSQQLKAVMGVQPTPDPLAEDIKYWSSQGYEEKDARAMAQYMNQKLQPVIQQNQQLQQSLQGTAQVTGVLQAVYEQDPGLFADPTVGQAVQKIALQTALQGQPVDMEYVRQLAINEWANKTQPWKQQSQQQAPPVVQSAQRPPFTGGFIQPGGYQPMPNQQQAKSSDPAVDALAAKMADYSGHKLT